MLNPDQPDFHALADELEHLATGNYFEIRHASGAISHIGFTGIADETEQWLHYITVQHPHIRKDYLK